ncbi:RNA polymerase subunit sigma-70 [Peteryoungia desertarenae]|uniref:RNA polymerase subunit sigma-70 n=1 Tax=Peteryoungia desertarenae TaxID=1813451 RepID=A0ABX6QSK0_9HYPH|nr:RNA polymerase subunit sigma-70 [Peteryoungia desertarenae]
MTRAAERVARESYGKLVAILALRDRDIASAEDALSDALATALRVWPEQGVPSNPEGWLVTAARNTRKNVARNTRVRRNAEPEILRRIEEKAETVAQQMPLSDERLRLMFVCAHPAIDTAARTPLILQTVLGIDAARIARLFIVPAATMSQRLVRAKARIRDSGLAFSLPEAGEIAPRIDAVLDAIYAAFGAGWDGLDTTDDPAALTGEAIWLARLIVQEMPNEPEPKGLLALMLYCAARRSARRDAYGRFVPLDAQDARLWDRDMVIEAESLLARAAQAGRFGRFQCEAAIQSVHIQRPITGRLNLEALRLLYDMLVAQTGSLGAQIGRAVIWAEAGDTQAAADALDALPPDRVATHQPWWVARARVAALAGDTVRQKDSLRRAIDLAEDAAVRTFLMDQYVELV